VTSTVDIPEIEFTPERARKKAEEMAKMIDATLD